MKKQIEPITFPQATTLLEINGKTALPVCQGAILLFSCSASCWKVPFLHRLRILFRGRLWVKVYLTEHPAMEIDTTVKWGRHAK